MKFALFFIFILCGQALGQEMAAPTAEVPKERQKTIAELDREIPSGKILSRYYRRGNYLIYDCEDQHFACVDDVSYGRCQVWRQKAIDKIEEYMPCAPLKRFESIEACDRDHYKYMYTYVPKKFCLRIKNKNNL